MWKCLEPVFFSNVQQGANPLVRLPVLLKSMNKQSSAPCSVEIYPGFSLTNDSTILTWCHTCL